MDDAFLAEVRGIGFVAGVLDRQRHEVLCGRCKGFARTIDDARARLAGVRASVAYANIPPEWRKVLDAAAAIIESVKASADPVPQRKLGNCKLKDGKCFVKYARRFALPDAEDGQKKDKHN